MTSTSDTTEPAAPTDLPPAKDFHLASIRVAGFRSLRDVSLAPAAVTVIIGANGSGKSNFLSALEMTMRMRTQSLRHYVGRQGGASQLLHYGPSVTQEVALEFGFEAPDTRCGYAARLAYAATDSFVFNDEIVSASVDSSNVHSTISLGKAHVESRFSEGTMRSTSTTQLVDELMSSLGFFHFHDTSPTSPLRQNARPADDRQLRSDGSNLAALLFRLCFEETPEAQASWRLIGGLIQRVAPFIKRLAPLLYGPESPDAAVRLYWLDERDHVFGVNDLSDGTLRALALITALAQPSSTLPRVIIIDEPELGLHPAALGLFASLVRSVSSRAQIILSTQSPALLDEFEPSEVVVADRVNGETTLRRLPAEELAAWLEDYSLSELYDKNLLGGRP